MVCGAYCPDQAEHEELEKEIESIWSMVHKSRAVADRAGPDGAGWLRSATTALRGASCRSKACRGMWASGLRATFGRHYGVGGGADGAAG